MSGFWTRNQGDYTVRDIERFSDLPPATPWAKWLGGLALPLLVLWPACKAFLTRQAVLSGDGGAELDLYGTDAVLFGYALASIAGFLHAHYFWGNSRRLIALHEAGKIVSLIAFCVSVFRLIFRLLGQVF